jgi:3'-phosphoadenosine 5'-phosphosulfate sulfotransferase (PAPS reductase)/FAD synthetase
VKRQYIRSEVWSCGGGTQSVAIAALICQGRLPKPDVSVIADTGYEKQSTWDYYESVLKPNLSKVGVDLVRVTRAEWACDWGKGLFATSGDLLMPAFKQPIRQ